MSFHVLDLKKTKMCLDYKVGCKNERCSFAHSKEELQQVSCMFKERCRKDGCIFFHPNQKPMDKEELFKSVTKGVVFRTESIKEKETVNDLTKTKMCLDYKVGCKNEICTFAHSKEELKQVSCMFKERCKKDGCIFFHPNQKPMDKEELFKNVTKGVFFKLKEIIPYNEPIIITLDEEDEDEEENIKIEQKNIESLKLLNLEEDKLLNLEEDKLLNLEEDKLLNLEEDKSLSKQPEKRRRIQFEAMLTVDEMTQLMKHLRSKENMPILLSLQ